MKHADRQTVHRKVHGEDSRKMGYKPQRAISFVARPRLFNPRRAQKRERHSTNSGAAARSVTETLQRQTWVGFVPCTTHFRSRRMSGMSWGGLIRGKDTVHRSIGVMLLERQIGTMGRLFFILRCEAFERPSEDHRSSCCIRLCAC